MCAQPGANEITILGLSPSVDEDSIKVEGTGSAIISDIAVELLPNRDIFQDIYPESDDETSDDEAANEEDEDPKKDSEALRSIREKLTSLRDDMDRANDEITSAATRLKILDAYGMSLNQPERKVDIGAGLEAYRIERQKVSKDHMDATIRNRQLSKEYVKLHEEETRLTKLDDRKTKEANEAKAKAQKAKQKEVEKQQRREAEKRKEKLRIKQERESFWPRSCWSVRITLDAVNLTDTPGSSRRSSIASASDLVKVVPEKGPSSSVSDSAGYTCDLSLSYVVSNAYWAPSYDLSLSTTSNTALLCFDAQLTNKTSENWSNCKIVLSTSQATFAGLQDDIPTLVPWHVRLGGRGNAARSSILDSREERAEKEGWKYQQNSWGAQKSRAHLYGVDTTYPDLLHVYNSGKPASNAFSFAADAAMMQRGAAVAIPYNDATSDTRAAYGPPGMHALNSSRVGAGLLGDTLNSNNRTVQAGSRGGLFGGAPNAMPASASGASGLFGVRSASTAQQLPVPPPPAAPVTAPSISQKFFKRSSGPTPTSDNAGFGEVGEAVVMAQDASGPDDDGATMREPTPELSFQETAFEETGLTTTYDLPGLKTLNTSGTASKQRVARVSFTSVAFSHTIVAKYKPVAYLKAKLRNGSKLTLLKGPVGLTLDGSFMGRSTLPRCSAGDNFTLSLGVDPAIDVVYPKPDVKRSTSGIFSKEDSSVYTRSVTIANTRAGAGKPVNLVVLDQVPVSEDERLRIAITYPRGVVVGGGAVPTGVPGKQGKENADWGKATAHLKKAGEVSWDIVLNAGGSVKLVLEYEVAVPGGEGVVQV